MPRPNADHVVLRYDVQPNRIECRRCRWSKRLPVVVTITELNDMAQKAIKRHRYCKAGDAS